MRHKRGYRAECSAYGRHRIWGQGTWWCSRHLIPSLSLNPEKPAILLPLVCPHPSIREDWPASFATEQRPRMVTHAHILKKIFLPFLSHPETSPRLAIHEKSRSDESESRLRLIQKVGLKKKSASTYILLHTGC